MHRAVTACHRAAPAFSAVALILLVLFGGFARTPAIVSSTYLSSVRSASEHIPLQVGDWLGRDVPPTPSAVSLLKPNLILQRQYFNPHTGSEVGFLFVHCSDIRDMTGHYPPICYPAHGWLLTEPPREVEVRISGRACLARLYRFHWPDTSDKPSMLVLNFFLAPTGAPVTAPTLEDVRGLAARGTLSSLGVAQVQFVFSELYPEADRQEATSELLVAIEPLIAAVCQLPERRN